MYVKGIKKTPKMQQDLFRHCVQIDQKLLFLKLLSGYTKRRYILNTSYY